MTQPLNFRAERDTQTGSWERADPTEALIERTNDEAGFCVTLRGGSTHTVTYEKRDGSYRGRCDCKGWQYRDDPHSPCAHLCVLRQAEWSQQAFAHDPDTHTTDGQPVRPTQHDDRDDQPDHDPGRAVATDGGHVEPPAAGADQRVFGQPEGRL